MHDQANDVPDTDLSKVFGEDVVVVSAAPDVEPMPSYAVDAQRMTAEQAEALIKDQEQRVTVDPVTKSLRPLLDDVVIPGLAANFDALVEDFSSRSRTTLSTGLAVIRHKVENVLAAARAHLVKEIEVKARELNEDGAFTILCDINSHVPTRGKDGDGTLLDAAGRTVDGYVARQWERIGDANNIITIADDAQLRKFTVQHGAPVQLKTTSRTKDVDEVRKHDSEVVGFVKLLLHDSLQELRKNLDDRNALVVVSTPRAFLRREAYMLESYVYCHIVVLKDHTPLDPNVPPQGFADTSAYALPFACTPVVVKSEQAAAAETTAPPSPRDDSRQPLQG